MVIIHKCIPSVFLEINPKERNNGFLLKGKSFNSKIYLMIIVLLFYPILEIN